MFHIYWVDVTVGACTISPMTASLGQQLHFVFIILHNLLHFLFVALKHKRPYISPLYLYNVYLYQAYALYMIHEKDIRRLFMKMGSFTFLQCVLITSVGFTYRNLIDKNKLPYISQTRGRYQKVVHENGLLYISPVNGINIRLLSMK